MCHNFDTISDLDKPVTTDPVTTDPVTTDSVTTDPVTTDPVTTDPVTTKQSSTASGATASEPPSRINNTSIGTDTSDSTSTLGAGSGGAVTIAGGIVGGVVATILLLLVIALVVFMWRKRRKTGNINILAMSNATYDGNNNIVIMSHVMSMFTCRSKPHWVTEWMWRSVCWYWSSSGEQYVHERTTCAGMYDSYTCMLNWCLNL